MQRMQRAPLHSRHAASGFASANSQLQRLVGRPEWHCRQQHRRQLASERVRPAAAGAQADGSEPQPLRPKAQAAAPVQPQVVDASAPQAGAGTGAAGPNNGQSYSSFYKTQNARWISNNNGSSNGSNGAKHAPPSHSAAAGAAEAAAADAAAVAAEGAPESNVDDALKKAQDALAAAETSLDGAAGGEEQGLREALLARALKAWLVVRPAVLVGTLSVALVASHAFGLALQWAAATLTALGIAAWGHRRGSLSPSGAVAAATVGLATLGCSLRLGSTLLAFFFASSKLTHFKEELKENIEEGAKRGGQRDWKQVLCNSGLPTVLAVAYGALAGCLDLPLGALPGIEAWRADLLTLLMGGFLGYYACCCGDTWASELGVLSSDTPRLVTTLKPVRRGTNGGVTLLGLSASIAGGLFTGAVFYLAAVVSPTLWVFDLQRAAAVAQWRLIPLGLMAGLFGSLVDSLLGATVQFTGYDVSRQKITSKPGPDVVHISGLPFLSNNAVNLVSATITSALTALAALRMFA